MTSHTMVRKWIPRWRNKGSVPGIASVEAFRALLEDERARVDRHGHELSLVIFAVGEKDEVPARPLARAVTRRKRSTDQLGWIDERGLGVVLPNTPGNGARKFAEDICAVVAAKAVPPTYRILTYPSQWLSSGKGDPTQLSNTDVPKDSPTSRPEEFRYSMDGIGPLLGHRIPGWKRFLDIVGTVFGLVLLLPVFAIIAVFIKIVSPGPVFFKQERVGFLGRPFGCWKFRTMRNDADITSHERYLSTLINTEEPMTKLDEDADPRIIPLGRFFRQSGLDELPQLFNVLRGEMSLIGPRPCIPYEAQQYLLWQRRRFDVMPGITGLWQVSGKNRTTFKEMIRLDIRYLGQRSFWVDLRILLKTLPALITQG